MSIRTAPWPAGVPCYVDLMTPDPAVARGFYADVLGWTYDEPSEEFGGYQIARRDGHVAAGLMPAMEGAPISWNLYFATDDIEGLVARVPQLGGQVLQPVMAISTTGRMAIAADPAGAVFCLWQGGDLVGAEITSDPGSLVWEDLRSSAPDVAREFYLGLFSYKYDPVEMASADYQTFTHPMEQFPLGGMGGFMGGPGPDRWEITFAVTSTDDAVAATTAAGGSVLLPAFDSPFGRLAGLADPFGAAFNVITPTGPTPDRAS
jgi:predicted enzyme related to lactoylglutathione lyase